jgi:hypothetical protein
MKCRNRNFNNIRNKYVFIYKLKMFKRSSTKKLFIYLLEFGSIPIYVQVDVASVHTS